MKQHRRISIRTLSIVAFFWLFALPSLTVITAMPAAAEPLKVIAPKLNVPIPGLKFTDYPVVRTVDTVSLPFLSAYITAVYKYLVGVSVVAAAVMIVFGGFKYILAASVGDVSSAKQTIADALVGLLLIFGTYTILTVVNSSFVVLKPLEVTVIPSDPYISHETHLDGVPLANMEPWDQPNQPATTADPARSGQASVEGEAPPAKPASESGLEPLFSGSDKAGIGKGCATQPAYKTPKDFPGGIGCSGDSCQAKFCEQKDYKLPGIPEPSQLVGFDDFPPTVGEQVAQRGITFVAAPLCSSAKGCDPAKWFSITTFGPSASASQRSWMNGRMRFLPEVRDALIKAGAAARAKGYFLVVGDGTRSTADQAQEWCRRIAEKGTSQGMATPGSSNHQLGIAVDIALYKLDDAGKFHVLTQPDTLCTQVANTELLGPENLKMLERIMSSVGFKHMCEEAWHFDFKGVYAIDCNECEFPGRMQVRVDSDSKCKKG